MPEIKYDPLPNKEAIAHFNGKVLLTTQHYAELKAYEHALAFTVAGIADKDMLAEVHKAMTQAMANGTSFHDFKKQLKPYLMAKGWLAPTFKNDNVDDDKATFADYQKQLGSRLQTIYHTNKATAYAAGQWERIQRTKEMLPFLQYMPSMSTTKRDNHKPFYGLVREVDDPIWTSIMPPNGFGCKCWVKQLTKTRAQKILDEQAEKGIVYDIEMEQVKHPLTGEMMTVPKGVHFSFNHNHDRLTALLKLAEDKHGKGFAELLRKKADDFMVDLIFQPDFIKGMPTVLDKGFEKRFDELKPQILEVTGGKMATSETVRDLQEKLSKQNNFAVATISPSVQELLGAKTAIIYLSDDNLIKEIARHPKESTIELFRNLSYLIKNADKVIQDNEFSVVYFAVNDKRYKITVKTTKSRKALFLGTIFELNVKNYEREINNAKKNAVKNGLATGEDPQGL